MVLVLVIEHIIHMIYENKHTSQYCKCCPYHSCVFSADTNDLRENLIRDQRSQEWESEQPYVSNILI